MPYISIQTNEKVDNPKNLLKELSAYTAEGLGKPEAYVMTALQDGSEMTFGGSHESLAFIQCKSIGLSESQTGKLSAVLCKFCTDKLGIPADRVYIEFSGVPGSMWGWKGGTF